MGKPAESPSFRQSSNGTRNKGCAFCNEESDRTHIILSNMTHQTPGQKSFNVAFICINGEPHVHFSLEMLVNLPWFVTLGVLHLVGGFNHLEK